MLHRKLNLRMIILRLHVSCSLNRYDRKTDTVESLRCKSCVYGHGLLFPSCTLFSCKGGKCGCLSDGLAQACSICGEALHEPTETDTDAIPLLPTSIYVVSYASFKQLVKLNKCIPGTP